jgi:hypothetical protein
LTSITHTAREALARKIVERLHRRTPYSLSWRDCAVREIGRALVATKMNEMNLDESLMTHESHQAREDERSESKRITNLNEVESFGIVVRPTIFRSVKPIRRCGGICGSVPSSS